MPGSKVESRAADRARKEKKKKKDLGVCRRAGPQKALLRGQFPKSDKEAKERPIDLRGDLSNDPFAQR